MVCPYCSSDTIVSNSRFQKRNNGVWRRRKCRNCQSIFTSLEQIDFRTVFRVKSRHNLSPFNPDILFLDILTSLKGRKNRYIEARELTSTVIIKLLAVNLTAVDATKISEVTAAVLKRFDRRAWHSYIADHPSLLNYGA